MKTEVTKFVETVNDKLLNIKMPAQIANIKHFGPNMTMGVDENGNEWDGEVFSEFTIWTKIKK